MKIFSLLIAALVIAFGNLSRAEEDGPAAREKVSGESRGKFIAGDWDGLESKAAEYRRTKARLPEGVWKLPVFYRGIDPANFARNEKEWAESFRKLDEWKKAHPKSITQRVAHALALTSYAWAARGGGWSSEVNEAGWKTFNERLAQARVVLDEAAKLPDKCPEWFRVMQIVALGQGWKRPEYDRLCKQATASEPTYYEYYFQRALHLQPKWHGKPGEWLNDAERAAREDDPMEGMTVYARTVWAQTASASNPFDDAQVSWDKMKRGFRDIERAYPNSGWNLNNFCSFAVLAGDRETARELMARIGDTPNLAAWENTRGKFEAAKKWALSTKAEIKPRVFINANGVQMRSVAFSPDGKSLAVGDRWGQASVWDIATGKLAWLPGKAACEAVDVAFSPDGKLLAVAWGSEEPTKDKKGEVIVFDVATRTKKAQLSEWKQGPLGVKFTPDGKSLVMAGGVFRQLGESQIWDTATGKTQKMEWNPPHTHSFTSLAVSPDGRFMVTGCGRSIDAYDLKENRQLLPADKPKLKRDVHGLAFSPDGLVLATATSFGWAKRDNPGAIVLWDVRDWKPRSQEFTAPNGLGTVAFSPKGDWLVGGGHDGVVRVWDVATGSEVAAWSGP